MYHKKRLWDISPLNRASINYGQKKGRVGLREKLFLTSLMFCDYPFAGLVACCHHSVVVILQFWVDFLQHAIEESLPLLADLRRCSLEGAVSYLLGTYLGWCVDRSANMGPETHEVTLYSSINPPGTLTTEKWDMVNYILNHK